jgi:hypothetical protein
MLEVRTIDGRLIVAHLPTNTCSQGALQRAARSGEGSSTSRFEREHKYKSALLDFPRAHPAPSFIG